ncbi:hypothetical protein ACO2E9_01965 [Staphylococcus aureus]
MILQKITAKARFEKELKNLRFNSLKEEKIKKGREENNFRIHGCKKKLL